MAESSRFAISSDAHRPVKTPVISASAQEMFMHPLPILADYIWIGGGTLGLIIIVVVVVLLMRK
jgi:hypothetical protein